MKRSNSARCFPLVLMHWEGEYYDYDQRELACTLNALSDILENNENTKQKNSARESKFRPTNWSPYLVIWLQWHFGLRVVYESLRKIMGNRKFLVRKLTHSRTLHTNCVYRLGFTMNANDWNRTSWLEKLKFFSFLFFFQISSQKRFSRSNESVRVNFRATYRTRSRPFKLTQQRNNRITRRNEQSEVKFRHFPTK